MTNHLAKAQHELATTNVYADDGGDYLLRAQAEATLYLAEQQRVANLIAAAQLIMTNRQDGYSRGIGGWCQDSEDTIHGALAESDVWIALLTEKRAIAQGLA